MNIIVTEKLCSCCTGLYTVGTELVFHILIISNVAHYWHVECCNFDESGINVNRERRVNSAHSVVNE